MRKLSAKLVPKCLKADQNVKGAGRPSNIWNFVGTIQMISCRDWWPWTKPGYITMTRRQSNNQWSGGIDAQRTPKNSQRKNPLEKFSPRFLGIKTASSSLIIFQTVKLSTPSITRLCWCNWRTFWRKNAAGSSPRGSCSSTTMPRLTGHFQPSRNWPTWASNFLITHPILRIWPRRTIWTEKTIERSPFVVRRGGHFCRGDLVGRTSFWFFFSSGLQKLE